MSRSVIGHSHEGATTTAEERISFCSSHLISAAGGRLRYSGLVSFSRLWRVRVRIRVSFVSFPVFLGGKSKSSPPLLGMPKV